MVRIIVLNLDSFKATPVVDIGDDDDDDDDDDDGTIKIIFNIKIDLKLKEDNITNANTLEDVLKV